MTQTKNRLHSVLIIGAGPAGVAAANKLGELGVPVTLVDGEADLDRKLGAEAYRLPSGTPFNFAHRPGLIRILRNRNLNCALPATIGAIKHSQQGFRVQLTLPATYVDSERCTLCGQCVAACPLEGTDHPPIQFTGRMALPGRAAIDKRNQPLCQADCPLGVNVQGYMALVRAGRFDEALALIRNENVLPAICGRICTHPCEAACRRAGQDGPLAIRDIKRFITDQCADLQACESTPTRTATPAAPLPDSIAVVGCGPSGLAAAADLVRRGFAVTIYEKEQHPGGLLRYGVGPHRLPRDILATEVAEVLDHDRVALISGRAVSLPEELITLRQSHRAVILATGSWADRSLGVPGETLDGVQGCLAFLNGYYRGDATPPRGRVAVIGDGNAAFDLARVLHRAGADVTLLSWFGRDEIPADVDEVEAALQEGITIRDRCQVVGFDGAGGRLQSVRTRATRSGPLDAQGIAWPVIVAERVEVPLAFDHAFVAIGQAGAYGRLRNRDDLAVDGRGLVTVDSRGRTSLEGIYAAGDAATGATSVVHAMADGRKIAATVTADLNGSSPHAGAPARDAVRPADRDFDPVPADLPVRQRAAMPTLPPEKRRQNFAEVALGLSPDQAMAEAGRCLQCGVCAECLACLPACEANNAIRHDQQPSSFTENAGVLIIADPAMAPGIKGEDVLRAYGPPSAKNDVHAMMLRGFAAAAHAMMLLQRNGMRMKGQGLAFVPPDPGLQREVRMGVFACRCNDAMGWLPEMDAFMADLNSQPDIVHAEVLTSACIPEGIQRITDAVRDKGLTRLVVAACVCCPLNFVCSACTDQRSRLKRGLFDGTGISRSMVQTCNLRGEALRMTAKDAPAAMAAFEGLIKRSIGRARKLLPFPAPARAYNFTTAVIGHTEAALTTARTLAEAGFDVLQFGGTGRPLTQAAQHPNVHAFEGSTVQAVSGTLGNFQVHTQCEGEQRIFSVGGVVLGEKSRRIAIYRQHALLPEMKVLAGAQKADLPGMPFMYPGTTSISGLFLADPPNIQISKRTKGEAVAVLAAAAMPRGPRQNRGFSVVVNESLCRGCGRCLAACVYQAVSLKPRPNGSWTATVDDALCKGCGNCISVCPSNAADSPYRDQACLEQMVEELLLADSRS
ncbi:FAD-dependent oxidoreductase [Desulfatitalea alkaliphila]|uniref:FAD-dependent oxidoreductase n=1 Tax=Desulfatitalea alkaliphila TaxID=2929485 RepID=A0AA41R4B4_9BACT|nr:FAD-dependent oxidoreductase [Desulfatitalea alkaliphila]MCJ8500830.1 FAD-dependent oxidoreductase [Desulfatitalea alkaliphila]